MFGIVVYISEISKDGQIALLLFGLCYIFYGLSTFIIFWIQCAEYFKYEILLHIGVLRNCSESCNTVFII